jgi:hypothetical protein
MANHTIDCDICGDDLRGSGPTNCHWPNCPGWLDLGGADNRADLNNICKNHPDQKLRELACKMRDKPKAA